MFKYIRIVLATLVLLLSLVFFLDFSGLIPDGLHRLMALQFVPAVMAGMWGLVIILLLSVAVFGRVYCSIICPFGILQDVVGRLRKLYRKIRKQKPNNREKYSKPSDYFRYGFLAITILPVIFGSTVVVTLLDPYSNFGRIATSIFKPVFVWGNNLLAPVFNYFGNYSLYSVTFHTTVAITVFAAVVLIVLVVLVWRKDRIWCNTVCPVGTLFGFLSRYSLFAMRLDKTSCGHCNKCTQFCKAHCIDHANLKIDTSRCVVCYNCVDKCTKHSITYKFRYFSKEQANDTNIEKKEYSAPIVSTEQPKAYDESRRRFLKSISASLVIAPIVGIAATVDGSVAKPRTYPLPPGAVDDFITRCTGCQLCVTRCPMNVLRPSFMERGWSGVMQPHMYFQPHAYCNYECTICSDVCPNGALQHITVDEKRLCQVGVVHFVVENCIVSRDQVDCGACAEHCPTGGVSMVEYHDGLTIPQISPDVCIGCGACESICPEHANAIFIEGLEPQQIAKPLEISEQEEVIIDGFGF